MYTLCANKRGHILDLGLQLEKEILQILAADVEGSQILKIIW